MPKALFDNAVPLRTSLLYALTVHFIVLLLLIVGLPQMPNDIKQEQAMIVEIITVAEFTNIKTRSQQKKAPQKVVAPKAQAIEETKVEVAKVEIKQEVIKPPVQEIKPEPKPEPAPIITPPPKTPEAPPVKQEKKAVEQPENKKKKKETKNAKAVVKSLKTSADKFNKDDNTLDKKFQEIEAMMDSESEKEFNQEHAISASEIDAIRSQITKAWNAIAFSGSDKNMRASLIIHLDKAGNVIYVKPVLEYNANPSYSAFVESMVRAAHQASPITGLSQNKFQSWKEIELTFSPGDMMY